MNPSSPPGPRVAVIGAGIIGTCIAYTLQQRGARVTLIDRDEPGAGCSYGNLGAISPGSVAPLAMPGILRSLPRMLTDAESPLRLPPAYLPRALPWLLAFLRAARPARVEDAARRLADLHANAVALHAALAAEVGAAALILRRGHLHLYPDAQALAKDATVWRLREAFGCRCERLDRPAITDLEPNVGPRYRVGMYLADHATVTNPYAYVQAIARACLARGGRLLRGAAAPPQRGADGGWRVAVNGASHPFDHVVVAAGVWTRALLAPLGMRLRLESQRGYHVQFADAATLVSRTVVLADRKVFVAPMQDGLRVGGTVEIAGVRMAPRPDRGAMLERIARDTFSGLVDREASHWMGHRPCLPGSVPIIGAVPRQPGLWVATGHGHLGLTDSVQTAHRIATALLGGASPASGTQARVEPEPA